MSTLPRCIECGAAARGPRSLRCEEHHQAARHEQRSRSRKPADRRMCAKCHSRPVRTTRSRYCTACVRFRDRLRSQMRYMEDRRDAGDRVQKLLRTVQREITELAMSGPDYVWADIKRIRLIGRALAAVSVDPQTNAARKAAREAA